MAVWAALAIVVLGLLIEIGSRSLLKGFAVLLGYIGVVLLILSPYALLSFINHRLLDGDFWPLPVVGALIIGFAAPDGGERA